LNLIKGVLEIYKKIVKAFQGTASTIMLPVYHNILKSTIMNNNLNGNWNEKKEKLKQKFQTLSDRDLRFIEGKENEMLEMLGFKLGKTKQELLSIIVEL
jgi:uncharacterized protein YjbJ (UPF0337 family)